MKIILLLVLTMAAFSAQAESLRTEVKVVFKKPVESLFSAIRTVRTGGSSSYSDNDIGITAVIDCEVLRLSTVCSIHKIFQGYDDGWGDDIIFDDLNDARVGLGLNNVILGEEIIGNVLKMGRNGAPSLILLDPDIVKYDEDTRKLFIPE